MKKSSGTNASAEDEISVGEDNTLSGAVARLMRLFDVTAPTSHETPIAGTGKSAPKAEPLPPRRTPLVEPEAGTALSRGMDALRMPVVIVDERLCVLHANEEARHVFGDKILGRGFSLFFRSAAAIKEIEETLADGQEREIDVDLAAPLKRHYKLRISRLAPGPENVVEGLLEFQESTLIRRSETMRSEFIANVSHELRSPLATLIGFIETLQDDGDDATTRERFLGIMGGEAQRMRRLINDLLSLTNVELHEHERPRTRVDLTDVLREVINSLGPRAKARDLDINLNCRGEGCEVLGERDQLIQVFHNLITNAIKYGADGGMVDITAEVQSNGLPDGGPSLEVKVRDYGQGIAPEHLPRLTERFYRVDKGRSRALGGTGLGLAIVKHIISRHRGRFLVDSELGKGSVFKVRLPIYRDVAN